MSDIALTLGDQSAVITPLGSALRSYAVGGRDVIVPFEGEVAPAMHGAVLAPWPNRLADGRYSLDGVSYTVPLNEPGRGNANHGLVAGVTFAVDAVDAASVTLSTLIDEPGYPFRVTLTIGYELTASGLVVTASGRNGGDRRAPIGLGFHPWLSPGDAAVDDCTLRVDAAAHLVSDARLLPIGSQPIPDAFDFTSPRTIGDVVLDDAFSPATFDKAGRSWVRLTSPDGTRASVWMERPLGTWQVCTGDFPDLGPLERSGVAAEPMTCPANAFNTGDGLIVQDPGETLTVGWGLTLDRP